MAIARINATSYAGWRHYFSIAMGAREGRFRRAPKIPNSSKKVPTLEVPTLAAIGLPLLRSLRVNRHWKRLLPVSGVVIVVEGNPTIRAFMMEVLSNIGLPLLGFENADDAYTHLSEVQGECPLVIADQGLPGQLQGTEFIEKLKNHWPSIAAILTSDYDEESHAMPPSALYLREPWSLDELVAAIATLLQPGTPIHKRWIYTY